MSQYSFESWLTWPNIGVLVAFITMGTLAILGLFMIFVVIRFLVRVIWSKRQLNEDDPRWLEYCRQLDNKK